MTPHEQRAREIVVRWHQTHWLAGDIRLAQLADALAAVERETRAEERERCAKVCEARVAFLKTLHGGSYREMELYDREAEGNVCSVLVRAEPIRAGGE